MDQELNKFIPFSLPDIGEEEIEEVVRTMKSGWITTGPQTKKFESDFVEYLGGGLEAIAVNSATAGLHLALEALGIGHGDEVITTIYTFTATAEVIRYLGAHPVFVDIDSSTFNIDSNKIEEKITEKTKAIILVHFGGLPCAMAPILAIAAKYKIKIIEDAAHALPARYNGQLVGALNSNITVFSFYATKPITTGEGGMIVTRNVELAKRMRMMRLHGISRDIFARYTDNKPNWFYEVIAPGFKYNLTDIAASIGIQQLKKADYFQAWRQQMAETYLAELQNLGLILPDQGTNRDLHSWHLFVVLLGESIKISRDEFINRMAELGVICSVHFIPLHFHPYWRDTYALKNSDFPIAVNNFERVVSLPIYTKMTRTDQARVISATKAVLS